MKEEAILWRNKLHSKTESGIWQVFFICRRISQYLDRPFLVIAGSEAGSLWQSRQAYELSKGPKELFVVEGAGHFDFYDNPACIQKTVDKLAKFFTQNL